MLLLLVLAWLALGSASALRGLAADGAFEWLPDPQAAARCPDGAAGCVSHVKFGFRVAPVNVSTDLALVLQQAARPAGLSAVVLLETYTQPGCVMSACRRVKSLPREDCFNRQWRRAADQPDGGARIDFGGIYYEHLPAGELYVKFERRNVLSDEDSCSFEVRSGYKRWF